MIDLVAQNDIERLSNDLLKQSKALDVYPTPVEKIVQCADLVISGSVDLVHVNESFLSKIPSWLRSIKETVRGILDRKERTIYLDLSQMPSRKNFVTLHETGHDILPWQREIMAYLENDQTLDPSTNEEFEAQANYFASGTLFQQDRFNDAVKMIGTGIDEARVIGKKFGGSVHATLRRMVEKTNRRFALIVLKPMPKSVVKCQLRDLFVSPAFEKAFGKILIPHEFTRDYKFAADYLNGRKMLKDQISTIPTTSGLHEFQYQYFNNKYNAFVLIFPKGEQPKTNTQIIITRG
ncbi:protein of unknown function [Chitinophaga ginsengisegetis]|uniref:IrrE N-terminal-like domain-containing protein n=1 Tax=Chitinophaga ginsengisegetis TaxID=393003 RepID=A0A1T5NJY4_9BACT|nr:ImmA/IrrE family metallo-endopeptidase [Chitinophaga ginsengisegetis]SKD00498.1 protein of unknown function [Chitinophaga ginsengisegetis]